ncbi:TetR/AcrR family transcriptional regulator [Enterococcus cecorum]|uniref:TetR/AcrR family transcriptional regulator n=1 Tax=Enterococcus cecorum TaxID=44008 RepID=UPI001FAE549C|nr:TetR/AcrR family transcriptional regulator [Enterococcus cecorum]MCJ0573962.1 TetR family transcriptional regulator [Enterococcus cecorum]MCJ0575581.1 TetR family transcriptional regulator [Enterococcus cecorum]
MPTETFLHLPDEKRKRITDAAIQEFSRVPLEEASIANIVKNAEIPRGSFYQYFENKEDVYFYCFQTVQSIGFDFLKEMLIAQKGDLFSAYREFFKQAIPHLFDSKYANFFKFSFMNMNYRSSKKFTANFHKHHEKMHANKESHNQIFQQYVNFDLLVFDSQEDLELLIQMIMNAFFSSVVEGYRSQKDQEKVDVQKIITRYEKKLNWLEMGASRKERIDV